MIHLMNISLFVLTLYQIILTKKSLLLCKENAHMTINITRLLDKLLTNYSKNLRPNHELGLVLIFC